MSQTIHQPVLLQETLNSLNIQPGRWYIDATLGGGGHTLEILQQGGNVVGIDQDPQAVKKATQRIKPLAHIIDDAQQQQASNQPLFLPISGNFSHLNTICHQHGLFQVSGILFDLGYSSDQLADPQTGLSFQTDGPLDMRLDPELQVTASTLVNTLSATQLAEAFKTYADEPKAKKIAQLIVEQRSQQPIETTQQLALLAIHAYGGKTKTRAGIHPATKIFQALRIVVNAEYDNLLKALPQAIQLLKNKGKIAIISFHSGEDRIVKNILRNHPELQLDQTKPITATQQEIQDNPRSRSAKLRSAQKI